jgi:CHAT domain-containing protein
MHPVKLPPWVRSLLRGFRACGGCLWSVLWRVLGVLLVAGLIFVWNNRHDLSALNPLTRQQTRPPAATLNDQGLELLAQGDAAGALAKFEQSLAIIRGQEDRSPETTLLVNEALAYDRLGEVERAIELYQEAAAIERAQGKRDAEAWHLSDMGVLYANLGRVPDALETQQQALVIFRDTKHGTGQADCLTHIGQLYESLGQWDRALAAEQEALALWRSGRDPAATAVPSSIKPGKTDSIGAILVKQLGAEALFRNRQGEAALLLDLASNYLHQDQPAEAAKYVAQALWMARDIEDRTLELTALSASGEVEDAAGNRERAHDLRVQALAIAREIRDRASESALLNSLAVDASDAHYYDEMRTLLQDSLAVARELGDPRLLANVSYYLGRLSEEQGDPAGAIENFHQALDFVEQLRAGAGVDDLRVNIIDKYAVIYTDAVRLVSQQSLAEEAFSISERARARTFLDQAASSHMQPARGPDPELAKQEQALGVQIASLEANLRQERDRPIDKQNKASIASWTKELAAKQAEYARVLTLLKLADPGYAAMVTALPVTISELQRRLDKDTTILSYFLLPRQAIAFIITRDTFRSVTLDVTADRLNDAVFDFRSFATLDAAPPARARQLYDWLVAPLRPYLTTRLVGVIPHGIVNYVPLGALYDGSHYLAEDYALFYLPSASALPLIQARRKPAGEQTFLALSYAQPAGLPALRFADAEAQGAAQLFGGTVLTGADATRSALQARAPGARILHIAAHADVNSANPLFSRIFLAPDGQDNGDVDLSKVSGLDLARADLVVLSACETQLGARGWGDDIVGLSRAFIYAGSPSVLASLWNVDDQATGDLMLAFYRNLKAGAGKAEALRAAQNEIRARYPNPYYWAAFTLIGDPGEAPAAKN